MILLLETTAGEKFINVAEKAKKIAKQKECTVGFDFNGIKCRVCSSTNIELLCRDYSNSWIMGWKIIGPKCEKTYDEKTQCELNKRIKEKEEKAAKDADEYRRRQIDEKAEFDKKVNGVEIWLKDAFGWMKFRDANTDHYGKCALDFAEGWAKLMQIEILKGKTVSECAEKASYGLDFLGITGFMYGCAVNVLSQTWEYGEDLRKWHNKKYHHEGDGVVNPAVLTISKQN